VREISSLTFLAHRIVSLKLDPGHHPLEADRLLALAAQGLRASLGRFDRPWAIRSLYGLWFLAVLISPRPVVRWLARQLFQPEAGRLWKKLKPSLQGCEPGPAALESQ